MSRAEVLKVVDVVRKQSRRSLEKLEEAAAKRAETLPYAAVVLERVMLAGQFDRVILSAFGLREGVLLERMSEQALAMHPLIAAAEALAGRWSRTRAFGARARAMDRADVRRPACRCFGKKRDEVVRGAAARLADVGGPLHPDQRVEMMFDLILRAPLAAISHEERAFLAAAIHHRYTKAPAPPRRRLPAPAQRRAAAPPPPLWARRLRLGADLSGRSETLAGLVRRCARLTDKLVLRVKKRVAHLVTETAQRRLDAAAQALGLTAETKIV